MTFVLASGSPRRKQLLHHLVPEFQVQVPGVDETLPLAEPGPAMEEVALRKARAAHAPGNTTLAADTAGWLQGNILGKPKDVRHAREMLESLNGQTHDVISAVAIIQEGIEELFHVTTQVHLDIPADLLDEYLASNEWIGKAGSYGLQDALIAPHATIVGSWSNVVGLPIQELHAALARLGVPCRPPPSDAELSENCF